MSRLRALCADDWSAVRRIYAEGIAGGQATFETDVPDWADFDAGKLAGHRFVAIEPDDMDEGGRVVGWAAVSPTSARPAYAGVVELSVYVDGAHARRGIGRRLIEAVVASTEAAGIWTVQGGVLADNVASLTLLEHLGFRRVGVRERVGRLHGRWHDVVLLERRSPQVS